MCSVSEPSRRWVLYALGGGMGHLHRAVALARCIVGRAESQSLEKIERRKRNKVCLLTNSSYANSLPIDGELGVEQEVIALPPDLNKDETVARVAETLRKFVSDVLVVDTFPRGLGGELPDLLDSMPCRKILVHRDLNPRYVDQVNLSQFLDLYDKLLLPGESAPFESHSRAVRTSPWLIRDDRELLEPAEARKVLGVTSEPVPVVAVVGCGKEAELESMRTVATRLSKDFKSMAAVRFISPRTGDWLTTEPDEDLFAIRLWPFLPTLRAVSVVVGGGGYNTVHETRCTETPLVGFAQPRLYDRQQQRLRADQIVSSYDEVRELVAGTISSIDTGASRIPTYRNGVYQAVDVIESLL